MILCRGMFTGGLTHDPLQGNVHRCAPHLILYRGCSQVGSTQITIVIYPKPGYSFLVQQLIRLSKYRTAVPSSAYVRFLKSQVYSKNLETVFMVFGNQKNAMKVYYIRSHDNTVEDG